MVLFDEINILPLNSSNLFWKASRREDYIKSHFTSKQWEYIVGNNFSENDFFYFLDNYPSYIRSYTLHHINGQHLAFLYILVEPNLKNVVSVHGGGWSNPRIHYQGYIMMLEALITRGLKVRTCCLTTNSIAVKFSRSVGFVPYKYIDKKVYMWINEKRLRNSRIYKYICKTQLL